MTSPNASRPIVVLGAGVTGLTAAWELCKEFPGRVVVLEKAAAVGGLAATATTPDRHGYDIGSHRLHDENHPAVDALIRELCGPELLRRERKGLIYIQHRPFRYPPSAFDIMTAFGLKDFVRFGLGFARARLARMVRRREPDNFEDYTSAMVGKGLYERFYKPYAVKLYGMSPRAVAKDPAVSRVRKFEAAAMVKDVRSRIAGRKTRTYLYPKQGIGQLCTELQRRFLDRGGRIHFISRLDGLRVGGDGAIGSVAFRTQGGESVELEADKVVSTVSLDTLHHLVEFPAEQGAPPPFDLRWRGLRLLYMVTRDEVPFENETFYFPESDVLFGRVSQIGKYSPALQPESDRKLLTIEIPCSPGDEVWEMDEDRLAEVCTAGLRRLGILGERVPGETTFFSSKLDKIYPVYDLGWRDRFEAIYGRLDRAANLYMIGRGALFLHCNIDHCMLMAIKLARHLAGGPAGKAEWDAIRRDFVDYRVRE